MRCKGKPILAIEMFSLPMSKKAFLLFDLSVWPTTWPLSLSLTHTHTHTRSCVCSIIRSPALDRMTSGLPFIQFSTLDVKHHISCVMLHLIPPPPPSLSLSHTLTWTLELSIYPRRNVQRRSCRSKGRFVNWRLILRISRPKKSYLRKM